MPPYGGGSAHETISLLLPLSKTMSFITCNDNFLNGIKIVDRQHHGLVGMIDKVAK